MRFLIQSDLQAPGCQKGFRLQLRILTFYLGCHYCAGWSHRGLGTFEIINSPNKPMHRNLSQWHWCWDIATATAASHDSGTNWPEQTQRQTQTHQHTYMCRNTTWLTLAHTHSWCSRWLAITRAPSANSHRLWCYYTLSSQRGSAISPLMTMIHSVWSDNSIYTPANDAEWKSERMIAAYVGATASMPTQSGHNTHTQIIPEYHDCPYTLLCRPSVLCPLPALSLSCLQSSKLWDCMGDKSTALTYTYQQNFLFTLTGNLKCR